MSDKTYLGQNAASFEKGEELLPISRVTIWYDEEHAFTAGDDTGRTLEIDCPWATQAMAEDILRDVAGFVYRPFSAQDALLDPAAELGDGVTVGGIYSVAGSIVTQHDSLMAADVGTPGEEELQHEYPYLSPQQRALARKVTLGQSYYGTTITRAKGLEIQKIAPDGSKKSRVVLNSDTLAFYNDDGGEALYFDAATGTYKFTGTLNVSDNFLVDAQGNVTINGNINLSGGTITWGGNLPDSGISSGQCRTIISEELVASPNIAGGKFWDLNQGTWIQMGTGGTAGIKSGALELYVADYSQSTPIFDVRGYRSGSGGVVSLSANDDAFLLIDGNDLTVLGSWDFSSAYVTGLEVDTVKSSGDVVVSSSNGDVRIAASNGEVRIFVDGTTWYLDSTGWHK